jgi:NitT/TauT family transport system substrate-binding protein
MKIQLLSSVAALLALTLHATAETILRFGHFPNITHAQGLIASQLSREGKGWFEAWLGPGVKIQWFHYNAGPSAMEAIFAGSLDLTYVGPNPALNAYVKSRGEEIRLIAGSALGGAALVVQPDGRITKPEDFKGRKLATPQLGNTQDVAARAWLKKAGFRITQLGGEVFVLPTQNPDQLSLFTRGSRGWRWRRAGKSSSSKRTP